MSGLWLKFLALLSMMADHTGMALFPQIQSLRLVGRLAFPLYGFLLAEGAAHTKNSNRYLGRLLLFALLSEVPFDLACRNVFVYPQAQNVFFTLFLGLAACEILKRFMQSKPVWSFAGIAVLALLAEGIQADYGAFAVMTVVAFFVCRIYPSRGTALFTVMNTGFSLLNHTMLQLAAPAAAGPILLYNGQRGRPVNRYVFYLFYPAHLLLLYLLRQWFIG